MISNLYINDRIIISFKIMKSKVTTFSIHYAIAVLTPLCFIVLKLLMNHNFSGDNLIYLYPLYIWWILWNIFVNLMLFIYLESLARIFVLLIIKALIIYIYSVYLKINNNSIKYAITFVLVLSGIIFWYFFEQVISSV